MTTAAPDRSVPSDAGERGGLEVRARAVERIVELAVAEVDGAGGSATRLLGAPVSSASRPRVRADVSGDLVTASIALSVPWPTPVPQVASAVRERVRARLSAMTGLRVGHLDLTVTALPLPRRAAAARVD